MSNNRTSEQQPNQYRMVDEDDLNSTHSLDLDRLDEETQNKVDRKKRAMELKSNTAKLFAYMFIAVAALGILRGGLKLYSSPSLAKWPILSSTPPGRKLDQ